MIPTVGQSIMGFILPFAFAFVAIPLESFISSSRTVLGMILAGLLRLTAFLLRLLGNVIFYIGRFIVNIYDLIIFPTIWLEGVVLGVKSKNRDFDDEEIQTTPRPNERPVDSFDEPLPLREPQE